VASAAAGPAGVAGAAGTVADDAAERRGGIVLNDESAKELEEEELELEEEELEVETESDLPDGGGVI